MSEQEPKAEPVEKTAGWVSVGIGTITLVAILTAMHAMGDRSLWLRTIVSFAVGITVFVISWAIARLCGVGLFGGIDGVQRDPATGRRLPRDESPC
jgi:hypothetical protein